MAMLSITAQPGLAADYPSRPVTLVAPSTPGSAPDVVARMLGERLEALLGQSIVVSNRSGAGTDIGAQVVANAEPDGYTVLLGSIAQTINPHLMKKPLYEISQLAPVSSVAAAPDILVTHPSVGAKDVASLIEYLKANPHTPAGHAGVGTTPHLSLELFRLATGVSFVPVPFRGGGAAQQGIMSDQVKFMFSTSLGIIPRIRSGHTVALAISSPERIAALPNLPTLIESNIEGVDLTAWFGLFVPRGTPAPIIEKLSSATREALQSKTLRDRLVNLGAEPLGSTPEAFAAKVGAEYAKWGKVVRDNDIRMD